MGAVKEYSTLVIETNESIKQLMGMMRDCGFTMADTNMKLLNGAYIATYNMKKEIESGEG